METVADQTGQRRPPGGPAAPDGGAAVDFGAVFRQTNEAMLVVDLDSGLIVDANLRLYELLRQTPENLLGVHHEEIFAADESAAVASLAARHIARQGLSESVLVRGDGSTVHVQLSTGIAGQGERLLFTCVVRDIEECRQAAARLASTNALLDAIGALQSQFIGAVPTNTLLKEILERFLALSGSEYGFLGESLRTADGLPYFKIRVMSETVWSGITQDFYAKNAPIGLEFYKLDNVFGAVLRDGEPFVANDFPAGAPHRLPEGHPPIRSFLALPLAYGGETLGFIGLANRPQGYDLGLADFLKPLLAFCGSLIGANRANQWRQGAEAELRRQALVFDNISDAVILTDRDGMVLDCNPAAVSMFGVAKKKLLGVPLGFMLSPDDARPVDVVLAAVDREACWSGLLTPRGKDGGQGFWDTTVLPLRDESEGGDALVWFSRDITERRAAQAKLAERTLELNTIADLSPDGFVFVDRNGAVTYVNPAFEQMTGLGGELVLGLGRDAFKARISALCEVPLAAEQLLDDECALLHLVRPKAAILKRTLRTLQDETGTHRGTVLYFRDVSQETAVDRMKSEFLSTAAHELRTPMASIFGFAELLLRRQFDAGKQREFLGIIHRQAGQLVSLVNELLDLARIEARAGKDFKVGACDLAAIVRASVAELFLADGGQPVNIDLGETLPPVLADPDKLQLALVNVLNNAGKYSMGRGAIDVETRLRRAGGGREVGVVVRDRGIGMTPEQVARIFERFYRADASGKIPGTGLGMSIVKEILDLFKGSVDVASLPGAGTEVVLWLPVAPGLSPGGEA